MIKRKYSYSSHQCPFKVIKRTTPSHAALIEIARLYGEKRAQAEQLDDVRRLIADFDLHMHEGTAMDYLIRLQTTMDAVKKVVMP